MPQVITSKTLHKHYNFVDAEFKNFKCDMFLILKFKIDRYSYKKLLRIAREECNYYNFSIKNGLLNICFKFPEKLKIVTIVDSDGNVMYDQYDLQKSLQFFVE